MAELGKDSVSQRITTLAGPIFTSACSIQYIENTFLFGVYYWNRTECIISHEAQELGLRLRRERLVDASTYGGFFSLDYFEYLHSLIWT